MSGDPLVSAFSEGLVRCPERLVLVGGACGSLRASTLDALSRAIRDDLPVDVGPGALVGIASPGGASFLAGVLALRRAGAAVLLLEPGGPGAARETATALGARALLECDTSCPSGPSAFRTAAVPLADGAPRLPAEAAFVKTTSGSTGAPRGIAVSTEAVLADESALASTMGIVPGDRIVAAVPLSHSYGFTSVALHALVREATLVMPDAGPFGPLLAAERAEATVFPTVPAYLAALVRLSQPPPWPRSLRLVLSAGAPLGAETARRFREHAGRPVHAFYGASECGGICFDREGGAAERGTVGTPVDGVRVRTEPWGDDAEAGLAVVESRAVATGYLPEDDGGRLGGGRFRTNDVVRWRRGELAIVRRADALLNVKGRKVDPAEIEASLAALEGVEEVVALGIPDPGSGGHTLRVVVASPEGRLTREDVLAFCRSRLADHKVPRSVELVARLPRTERGKVDRAALAGEPR